MVRREVIEEVGTMTEVYFLFYEEFDWSRRMREVGYKLFYEPTSVVYHKESMSIPKETPFREYYLTRSRLIYAWRNCQGIDKYLACGYQLFLVVPKRAFLYLIKKRLGLAKAGCTGILSGLFLCLKKIEFIFIQSSLDYTLFLQREVHPHAVLPIANGRAYSRESSI